MLNYKLFSTNSFLGYIIQKLEKKTNNIVKKMAGVPRYLKLCCYILNASVAVFALSTNYKNCVVYRDMFK